MSRDRIKYRERVPPPKRLRIGAALFVAVFFWWMSVPL